MNVSTEVLQPNENKQSEPERQREKERQRLSKAPKKRLQKDLTMSVALSYYVQHYIIYIYIAHPPVNHSMLMLQMCPCADVYKNSVQFSIDAYIQLQVITTGDQN